ncbi:MAG TPA: hypothetical protein VN759_04825 [Pseudolysinimonas sp.]|nr:hypothetical protein [Pseudolysinimonas sp.]
MAEPEQRDKQEIVPAPPGLPIGLPPRVVQGFDRVLAVQRPVVLAHIRSIRSRHPDATPAEVIRSLERRYLAAVTGGGTAVGAAAAIPAVGVVASLALSGAETLGFLEASALFAQSVTEVHGIVNVEPERARTLVMTLMLGSGGQELVQQLAGQAAGGASRNAFWGELVTKQLPRAAVGQITDRIRSVFLKRFAVTQGGSAIGRAIPFGIGAVIGGAGNHLLGRKVVQSSRSAFGPAPRDFPAELDTRPKARRAPRTPRGPRALPRMPRLPRRRPTEPPGFEPDRPEPSSPQPPNPEPTNPDAT